MSGRAKLLMIHIDEIDTEEKIRRALAMLQ
jgi:hypothetical protein